MFQNMSYTTAVSWYCSKSNTAEIHCHNIIIVERGRANLVIFCVPKFSMYIEIKICAADTRARPLHTVPVQSLEEGVQDHMNKCESPGTLINIQACWR
jgi:hypothetical protein